jgi:DNA-binding NarL/FixJ family response regulator
LIVDDHPLIRTALGMRISLQPDLQVCGEAATVDEALAMVAKTKPHLAVIDVSLQAGDGLDLVKQIRVRHPHVKMLVLSGFDEALYAERALRAGALGYLNKQESDEKVIEAIRTVLAGDNYISPAMAQRLARKALNVTPKPRKPIESLSDRELEVFRLLGEGLTNSAIADRLFLSPNTVFTHRENIKRKLGLSNITELTRAAVQWVLENG